MTRKVFTGVLAALMLFAFVACDNSGTPTNISYVEATTDVVYIAGETPNPADWTFTGYSVDGASSVRIPSNQFTFDNTASGAPAGEDQYVVAFKWADNDMTAKGVATMYALDKIEVTLSDDAVTTYYSVIDTADKEDYQKIDRTGVTVTATYNGSETKVISNDDKGLVFKMGTIAADALTEVNWAETTNFESATHDYVVQVSFGNAKTTYDVKFLKNVVSTIEFDVDDDLVLYYGEKSSEITALTDYASMIEVKPVMANGQVGPALSSNVEYVLKPNTDTSPVAFTGTANAVSSLKIANDGVVSAKIYAKYLGTDVVEGYVPGSIESRVIAVEKDAPVGIVYTASGVSIEIGKDYRSNATEPIRTLNGLTVRYEMASDKLLGETSDEAALTLNPENTATNDGYTITTAPFSEEYVAGMPQVITIQSLKYPEWTANVNVTLAAASK